MPVVSTIQVQLKAASPRMSRRAYLAGVVSLLDLHGIHGCSTVTDAWKELKGDGTADDSLDSMNDGQTHREKLMSDPSVRDYKEGSEDFGHGSHGRHGAADRSRGGGRGGRGGGHMGSRAGRAGRYGPAR